MVTKPRTGQTPSKATLAKLSTATYSYGTNLSVRNPYVAPDGGSVADYPKGWRFMEQETGIKHNSEVGQILKKNPKVVYAMERLHNLGGIRDDASGTSVSHRKVIYNAYYDLVIAPQIKAQEEQLAKQKKAKELEYATLKMRVIELEKKQTPVPVYENNTDLKWSLQKTSTYLPFAVVGIVLMVILIILRRRA